MLHLGSKVISLLLLKRTAVGDRGSRIYRLPHNYLNLKEVIQPTMYSKKLANNEQAVIGSVLCSNEFSAGRSAIIISANYFGGNIHGQATRVY